MADSLNKLKLLVWKNYIVHFLNFPQTLAVLLTPTLFCILFVIFRWVIVVDNIPAKESTALDLQESWQSLKAEIEKRHQVMMNKTGKDNNNVFMPQMIIAYTPADLKAVENIMERAINAEFSGVQLRAFNTCDELKRAMNDEFFFAGVCFFQTHPYHKVGEQLMGIYPVHMEFTLVFPSERRMYMDEHISCTWDANKMNFWRNEPVYLLTKNGHGMTYYVTEGAILLQKAVTAAYIDFMNVDSTKLPDIILVPFPEHEHVFDNLTKNLCVTLSFFVIVSHLTPILYFIKFVLTEKANTRVMLMEILYVSQRLQFIAWIAASFPMMCVASLLSISLLKIHWNEGYAVLTHTPLWILILIFVLYNISSLCFCHMLTNFFTNSSVGIGVISIIWCMSYLPYVIVTKYQDVSSRILLVFLYIFPNSVLGLAFRAIEKLENSGNGLKWELLMATSEETLTMYLLIFIALVSIYSFLTLLMVRVSLNYSICAKIRTLFRRRRDSNQRRGARKRLYSKTEIFEIKPDIGEQVIEFKDITLIIDDVTILNNVTFSVYEGEFLMLMGHNGAGKSILLQIAIGLLEPTSGTVTINKCNALEGPDQALTSLGVCLPQMLFDELTVENQLWFFSQLRGLTAEEAMKEVEKYLKAMELTDRRHILTKNLTRGVRQCLAVCVALVGGTKVVLLDEPSSQVDMTAQKQLWNLLHEEKKNRTILMITQSGLEADLLADRIIILSNGGINCGGSPDFLRHMCGYSYRATLYKKPECISENVTQLLRKYIPNISPDSDFNAELSYTITEKYVDNMGPLLSEIDKSYNLLGLEACTLSGINIDDVFYNYGAEYSADGNRHLLRDIMNGKTIYDNEHERYLFLDVKHNLGRKWLYELWAMMYKHFIFVKSYKMPFLVCLLTVVLSIIASIFSLNTETSQHGYLSFHIKDFPDSTIVIGTKPYEDDFIEETEEQYRDLVDESLAFRSKMIEIDAADFTDYLHEKQHDDVLLTNLRYTLGVTFARRQVGAHFNTLIYNTAPVSLNTAYNAILRALLDSNAKIKVKFETLPYHSESALHLTHQVRNIGSVIAINLALCTCYLGALQIFPQVKEQNTRFKFIQIVSGLPSAWYWISTLLSYIIQTIIASLIFTVTIFLLNNTIFSIPYIIVSCFLILVLTGIAFVSVNYVIARPFTEETFAYIAIITFHGFGCFGSCLSLNFYSDNDSYNFMDLLFRIFPLYTLSAALTDLYSFGLLHTVCKEDVVNQISEYVENCKLIPRCCDDKRLFKIYHGILDDVLYLIVIAVVCWFIIYLLESNKPWFCSSIPSDYAPIALTHHKRAHGFPSYPQIDDDVIYEQIATEILSPRDFRSRALVCKKVGKFYESKAAIKRLTFQLESSDCLALLGPNGSGKSTLLSLIVGEKRMSYGSAYIKNVDINKNPSAAMKHIGYSAKSNTLHQEFTVYETMKFFCLILCIERREILPVCENLAKVLGIYTFFNMKLKHCSTGILMRVNCAIAILKRPKLLCLDSPTASVDLAGQRMLWNVINSLRRRGTAVIFSSFTMTECKTHSTKLAVMYDGSFDVIGPTFKLSSKHQYVYCVYCKMKRLTISNRKYYLKFFFNLTAFMEKNYPTSRLSDTYCNILVFQIPMANCSVGEIFEKFNHHFFELNLETYFITRETLTTVYLDSVEKEKQVVAQIQRNTVFLQ